MKIIKITTDNVVSVHELPEGNYSEQNEVLADLIGPKCRLCEHVMPNRLYKELGGPNKVGNIKGNCVSMLIDEDGLHHDLDVNYVGSFLYETDKHGNPIVGDILIVGEVWTGDGIDFCGMSEQQLNLLNTNIEELTKKVRDM